MDPLIWAVLACTALSGFFALMGYSLRAFRRSQFEEALNNASGKARLETLDRHLSALRLNASFCRGVANIALVVAVVFWLDVGGGDGGGRLVAAVAVAGSIITIFGVAIPHAWAACADEQILAATLPVMLALRRVLLPVTWVMQLVEEPIQRLAGAGEDDGENAKQEILQAASNGRAEGAVDSEEVQMIESVMEFGDSEAGEIMTPRTDVAAVPVDTPWRRAVEKIVEAGHTRMPVYQGDIDNIIGVLYAKDMLRLIGQGESVAVRELMRKPFFVPETKALDDLLREFKARKVHLAVVLDEYGGTAGVVTLEDLLEEIVGPISDEYDRAEPALMQRIDDRTVEADGRLYVNDLNDALGLRVPEDADYDTIAGLVFSELGYIPAVDEKLEAFGAEFTVLGADERKITRLRVHALEEDKG